MVLGAMLIFVSTDAIAKHLTQTLSTQQIVCIRYLSITLVLCPILLRQTSGALRTSKPILHMVRGLLLMLSSLLFVFSLEDLPLELSAAIGFAAPLYVTALSIPLLGEQVGVRRWGRGGGGVCRRVGHSATRRQWFSVGHVTALVLLTVLGSGIDHYPADARQRKTPGNTVLLQCGRWVGESAARLTVVATTKRIRMVAAHRTRCFQRQRTVSDHSGIHAGFRLITRPLLLLQHCLGGPDRWGCVRHPSRPGYRDGHPDTDRGRALRMAPRAGAGRPGPSPIQRTPATPGPVDRRRAGQMNQQLADR